MVAKRGFGVAGALDHGIVEPLAREVEGLGYSTLWVNDTPSGDGLSSLSVAARVTSSIRLGVGVIAVDRVPASRIIARVHELGLPLDRILIGIGAGRTKVGSLELIRSAAHELRAAGIPSAVGCLGPKMVALTGQVSDAALFNWLTPAAATESARALFDAANGREVEPIAYVRVGFGEGAHARVEEEAARYEAIPAYGDHFARMGVRAVETCVLGVTAEQVDRELRLFEASLSEVVARAITGEETLEAYLALSDAAAPATR